MFIRIWQYLPRHGRERDFEQMYGVSGAWVRLFERSAEYRGTELRRVPGAPEEYQTIDRWTSREAWEAFMQLHAAAYEDLDRLCERLTAQEQLVAEIVEPDDDAQQSPVGA